MARKEPFDIFPRLSHLPEYEPDPVKVVLCLLEYPLARQDGGGL